VPLLIFAGTLAAGCDSPYQPMPVDQVCLDTGYAIAARTFACGAGEAAASARFKAFETQFRCLVTDLNLDPVDVFYHCVAEINATTCEDVDRLGDDLNAWLALSPACTRYLAGDGARGAGPTADAGEDKP
jgi:hypothetical protein